MTRLSQLPLGSLASLRRGLLPASLVAASILFGSCEQRPRWNVLLVTFDTTRADRLASYGDDRIETPTLDALAAEGVRFDRAFSAVPITAPSHSTIMTGKLPPSHGFRDNALFVLSDQHETLAEVLRADGYATGAAVGSYPLLGRFGLDQGFDFYDDAVTTVDDYPLAQIGPGRGSLFFDERPAGRVNEAILPWLEEHADAPFFAWVHYFDPHHPHVPPAPYDQLYAEDLYRGEIAYSDESLGTIIRHLEELGVYDRTLVVFTADHGEGLGEHNELTHSMLVYNSTLRVPLIVRVPGAPGGRVVEQQVATADILPTILALLDLPSPEGVQGRDLSPALRGEELPRRALYAETLSPRLAHRWGELRALYDGDYKYIFGPRPELYDVARDPNELRDLAGAEPERAADMRGRLEAFLRENASDVSAQPIAIDETTRQKLMALGYLHSSVGPGEVIEEVLRADGQPPQDRVVDVNELSNAKQLIVDGRPLAARELVLKLLERSPGSPMYLEMLVSSELQLGKIDAALESLEKLRGVSGGGEGTARLLAQAARARMAAGEIDAARELVEESLELHEAGPAHHLLGLVLARQNEPGASLQALRRAVELQPGLVPARVDLAVALAGRGEDQEAESHFLQALKDYPYFPRTYYNYATLLLEYEEYDQAEAYFRRAVELDPSYLQARYALVALGLGRGRLEQARRDYDALAAVAPRSEEARRALLLVEEAG